MRTHKVATKSRRSPLLARKVHAGQIKRPAVDLLSAIGGEPEVEASQSQRSTSSSTQPLGLRCQRPEAISAATGTRAQEYLMRSAKICRPPHPCGRAK